MWRGPELISRVSCAHPPLPRILRARMPTDFAARRRAELVLLAITAGWALTFVTVQDALVDADPFSFVAVRFAIAFVGGAVLCRGALLNRAVFFGAVKLAPFLFGGFALQTLGLDHTTPARAGFLTGLAVLFVPLIAFARTRRVPSPPLLVGVAIAAIGLWVLAGPGLAAESDTLLGDLLCVGCAIAFAGHIAFNEDAARKHAALPLVTWQFGLVVLFASLFMPLHGVRFDPTWRLGGALLFCGLFASLAFLALQTWGQRRTSATRAAMVFSVEPLFAASYSVLMGRDPLTGPLVVGGVLLAGAVLVAELGGDAWERRFGVGAETPPA